MAATPHEVFSPPTDVQTRIWRYVDLAKFLWLLSKRSLFFARADSFSDPFEGSFTRANVRLRPEVYAGKIPEAMRSQLSAFAEWSRQWTFVQCWHGSSHESAAMWDLYASASGSIALQSTFARLRDALPSEAFVGAVQYVDYANFFIPEHNSLAPYVHKRLSFEHEREIRAIIQRLPTDGEEILVGKPNPDPGVAIEVELSDLLEQIVVAPTSPSWFAELVVEVTGKYGLTVPVIRSQLEERPVY